MTDEALTIAAQLACLLALGLVGGVIFRKSCDLRWLLIGGLTFVVYAFFLSRGLFQLPNWPEGARWNWTGKALALMAVLGMAALPIFGFKRVGLTFQQKRTLWPTLLVFFVLCGIFLYLALGDEPGMSPAETIAFQWTMPGLDEEIFFRGVLLVALNEAFRKKVNLLGAPIGYGGFLTCVLFGLIHALEVSDGVVDFTLMSFLMTGVPSVFLLWLRERTGSLVLPILAHNFANGIGTIV